MFGFLTPFFAAVGSKAATFGVTKVALGQAALGAGVSMAASAVMNKSADNRPQKTTTTSKSRTNFQEMRDDAIAAGYNPLTALRMTGAAGNVTTTGTSVINTPALSSRAVLGRAIGAGLNSLGSSISSYDPLVQKQKELNIKLAEQQLKIGNKQLLGGVGSGRIGDTALGPSGIDAAVSVIKPEIHIKDEYVNDDIHGTTTTRMMPDGSLKTSPSGEDFGEILLNTVMGGSYMMGKGFGQLWKSPELMLQSGIDRLPNIPTLKQIQAQQAKD